MLGTIIIYITFALTLISSIFYFLGVKNSFYTKIARFSFYGVTAGFVFSSMFLLSNIVSHNFQYAYIFDHSSKELPDFLLIASFYAGQEGSFMLWGLLMSILGYLLIPYVQKRDYENHSMAIFSLVLAFVAFILTTKSPFTFIWEVYPEVQKGFMPKNGRGLNPVLQNYWIAIHPPILFTGYSSLTIPFVIAMAGLLKKDYRKWMSHAIPWTLWSAGILGLGIMLGGFWAYETLGWGGFWAWDPVENSSLIPWLVVVALTHTLLVGKNSGGLVKTNFALSIAAFIMVLYATFLTRSGILGDTSVHSFVDPGVIVYNLLLVMMLAFTIFSIVTLLTRLRNIPKPKSTFDYTSKEFGLSIGSIIILFISFVVFLGTSKPIFSDLLGGLVTIERTTTQPEFYNSLNAWLAVLMLLVNSYVIFLRWKRTKMSVLLKETFFGVLLAVLATITLSFLGVNEPKNMILAFSTLFSIIVNIRFVLVFASRDFRLTGAYLSHLGIALLILGALFSGAYTKKEVLTFKEGDTKEFFNYKIRYNGKKQIEKHWRDRDKFEYNFTVIDENGEMTAKPILYWSDYNERKQPFPEPGIASKIAGDIYLSPYNLELKSEFENVDLCKGETLTIPADTSYSLSFLNFKMPEMPSKENKYMKFGAIVEFKKDTISKLDTLFLLMDMKTNTQLPVWIEDPEMGFEIGFTELQANKKDLSKSKASFGFNPYEEFVLEVSTKPMIKLVWVGTILMTLGFFLSIFKYIRKQQKTKQKDIEVEEEVILENK